MSVEEVGQIIILILFESELFWIFFGWFVGMKVNEQFLTEALKKANFYCF